MFYNALSLLYKLIILFSPNLTTIKAWYISSTDSDECLEHLLSLLNQLKAISPKMKQCTIELEPSLKTTMTIEGLQKYCIEVNTAFSNIEKQWNNILDFCLHINLKLKIFMDFGAYINNENFKRYFDSFPDFEIEELLSSNNNYQFSISKKLFLTINDMKF